MTQFDSKLIAQAKKTKGYLLKKSTAPFSTWKKKYFIFLHDSLRIFKDQTLQSLQKSLNFSDILQVHPVEPFQIQIKTYKKSYFLKSDSSADQDLWIASINILKQNYIENIKNPKKTLESSHSLDKSLSSSFKSIEHVSQKNRTESPSRKNLQKERVTYLLKEKELAKLLNLLCLEKLSMVTKEEKFLSRILFIEDKNKGVFFSLSSKSIYSTIDGQLVKEDFIYPYQLNVLYFLPIDAYRNALETKKKSFKLSQICKCSEILECSISNSSTIKLQIHCQKSVEIQLKHLSEPNIVSLLGCIKKMVEVGKQYWNLRGKLVKNIDEFIYKFEENNRNELFFYKMVENQFQTALKGGPKLNLQKNQVESFISKVDSLTSNLKNFVDACEIKNPPLNELKEKFVKLYHKFVYNHLSQNWNFVYKNASDEDLIVFSKKVFTYFQVFSPIHKDIRVYEGSKTLLKIALRNFYNSVYELSTNFTDIQQESLRILKKIEFQRDEEIISDNIFFSTYCTNLFSILTLQMNSLSQIPKSDQFVRIAWVSVHEILKSALAKLSQIAERCKQRSSLISICNSLRILKKKKIPELFSELEKTVMLLYKREKEDFIKKTHYQIGLVETFCVKKLFVITFSSIDKELLKHQIKNIDFQKICSIVIDEISKLEHILLEVRTTMYESAFEEVCYFFYICIIKFDNKSLSKDECISMINQKMTAIRDCFYRKVDEEKILSLLKDLNLLKQFITCPINNIKLITKELKKVFGSNFTELNLKNLISLRVNTLKQKQYLFEQCREEIKNSYNSLDEMDSFQRESFANTNSRRERVSTLTESIKEYCQQFEKTQIQSKKERTVLFGIQNSIKEGYMYRRRLIKNFNTSYNKFFYRLKKGKLFEYDNQNSEGIINCYLLNQLKKCFLEPDAHDCFHLQFEREVVKFRTSWQQEASQWINKILEAMEEQKYQLGEANQLNMQEEGVLFEDFSKKISLETKDTNQPFSPKDKNKMNKKVKKTQEVKISLQSPKKIQNVSPKKDSPSKLKTTNNPEKKRIVQDNSHKKTKEKGCGAGCNFF